MVETVDKSFEDFFLSEEMLKALKKVGYKQPTPVQSESIPLILAGIDLIVQSQTGSGKTAAFAVPTIELIEPEPGRIEVLVLSPTRELAKQSANEFERLGQYKELAACAIYGGSSYEEQYKALETAQIVCATPGRLLDLANRGNIDLSKLRIFCLDEADEMLSMGFREELNAIVEFLPEERQSLLFSATVNEDIKSLARGMLYYPEYISLSGDQVAAEAVTHVYYRVKGMGRQHDLLRVLEFERPDSAIIFCNTKGNTFLVTEYLQKRGYRAKVLNGDLPQKQREATLAQLRGGELDYIVATDVAARGIDITGLSHVINYELPSSAESYVHRTGRTGRAGKTGRAISLVAPADMATHFDIMAIYDIDITQRTMPSEEEVLEQQADERLKSLISRVLDFKDVALASEQTRELAGALLEDKAAEAPDLEELLAKLLGLADRVLRDDALVDIIAGRAKAAPAAPSAPEAKRAEKKEEPREEARAKKERDEAPEDQRRGRRKRRSSGRRRPDAKRHEEATAQQEKAEDKTAEASEAEPAEVPATPEASEAPRRRRRRHSQAEDERAESAEERSSSRGGRRRRKSSRRSSKRRSSSQRSTRRESKGRSTKSAEPAKAPSFRTSKMYMNVGRDHVENNEELVEMICYMSGFSPEDFGEVSVQSSYSFVQVRDEYFYDIISAMNNQEWKGVSLSAEPARK